jgi:hypothetical protein
MIVFGVDPMLLLIVGIAGLGLALIGWLLRRFGRHGRDDAEKVMWVGIGIAGVCVVAFVVGKITGSV